MKENKYARVIKLFAENNKILRRSEMIKLGIPAYLIYEMLAEGLLVREERGLYRLTDDDGLSNPDLVKISLLIPKAVICLTSALYFYDLTSQIPHSIYIALPRAVRKPRITYPPIDVSYISPKIHSEGIDTHILDGVSVKIYSPEKTIADCFKFPKKVGLEVAIEALKDYMKKPQPKIEKLIQYAKINRVQKKMRPYLETLL